MYNDNLFIKLLLFFFYQPQNKTSYAEQKARRCYAVVERKFYYWYKTPAVKRRVVTGVHWKVLLRKDADVKFQQNKKRTQ